MLTLALILLAGQDAGGAVAWDGSLVIDHGDPGYSESGAWENGGDGWEQRGQSYSLGRQTRADGAWARWTPRFAAAGTYRVYLWNIPFHSQDSRAKIEVVHGGGTKTVVRDLRAGYFGWISLGDFPFKAGSEGYVQVTRGDRTLLVDAARFKKTSEILPVKPLEPYPPADGKPPYLDKKGPAGRLILGGKPYLMLGGELENTSALEPMDIPFMDELFDTLCEQKINTVLAPIAWKQLEAKEGEFDFSVVDALLERARARNQHLVLLWFGTWKNLQSYYAPPWVIHDRKRFWRVREGGGKENPHVVSPFCKEALEADSRAFRRLLERVVQKDPKRQVVLMVQVENEMPSRRDYAEPALEVWRKPVPKELMDFLAAHEAEISPWLRQVWAKNGRKAAGAWAEVFGEKDGEGGRVFGAWSHGRYADAVARAGKAVLDVPMFVNAWRGESPCDHRTLDVFAAAAPSIDMMGPDVYLDSGGYSKELALSGRSWNNLVVPENNSGTASAVRPWVAYATHHALLYANYWGSENRYARCGETYALMTEMAPLLLEKKGRGEMMGFVQEVQKAGQTWQEQFQGFTVTFTAADTIRPEGEINSITGGRTPGGGCLVRMAPGDFLIVGTRVRAAWAAKDGGKIDVAAVEEGHFEKGLWVKDRDVAPLLEGGALRLDFPVESGRYAQFRLRLR